MSISKTANDTEIAVIFNESQLDHIQEPLVTKLIRIYNETDSDEFTDDFIICLKTALGAVGDVNIAVDKVFEFVTQFIITVAGLDAPDNSHVPEETLIFCYNVFNFLKENHDIPSPIVRKRVCQLISKLLLRMSPNAMLDCKICDIIVQIMLERIKDKVPVIRMQAILAVYRLQDKSDKKCPVTKALADCMENDTSAEVRRLALSKISLVHRYLIERIIERTDDLSEKVRKEAYVVLSRLHVKQFTIEQRKRLLDTGLYDNNELVRNTVMSVLLPSWLKRLDSKYLDLLKALDLQVSSMEMSTKALMSLFKTVADEDAVQTLKPIMDNIALITFDKLTPESAFFWRCYVFFISSMVSEKNNYRWESTKSYDASQDGLLPDLSVFCTYIKTYYEVTSAKFSKDQTWRKKEQEFILIQLVELCKTYDYGDEVGRKQLKVLCLELLKNIEMETVRPVTELYFMLQTNLNESISKITELINDLLYPNITNGDKSPSTNNTRQMIDPNEEQNIKFKIAQLNVKICELKELQEDSIKNEDYSKAQDLKISISDMQDNIQELKATLMGSVILNSVDFTEDSASDNEEKGDPVNPLENLEATTVGRCLTILQEMLHLSVVKQLTPELRTLFQVLVLPACKSDNCIISPLATEVLGSCCLRDVVLAKEHFTTLFALCGKSDICASALKVMFDFLLCFGPNAFDINNLNDYEKHEEPASKQKKRRNRVADSSDDESSEFSSDDSESDDAQILEKDKQTGLVSGYTFISVLVDLLNDEFVDARFTVVHGLCQLMATGKLKSAKVLTRLILIWYHPASKDSIEIRDCLNFFFPFYVKHCPWSLALFETAILSAMDTLFNAPVNNPLYTVDQKCILKTLCTLTSPSFVHDNPEGDNTHFNIAVSFCNHIIDLRESNPQSVLLKGLDYLDLTSTDPSMLPTLENLIDKIIKKLNKKSNKKLTGEAKKLLSKIQSIRKNRQRMTSIQNTISEQSEEHLDEAEES